VTPEEIGALPLWNRRAPCPYCGGDDVSHAATARSLAQRTGAKIRDVFGMPCTLVNRLHRAVMEAERDDPPSLAADAGASYQRVGRDGTPPCNS
jgi:hypothetical protein